MRSEVMASISCRTSSSRRLGEDFGILEGAGQSRRARGKRWSSVRTPRTSAGVDGALEFDGDAALGESLRWGCPTQSSRASQCA